MNIKKGFTLIELLVVISIIGILAALATVSFTGTQKQARDTQRKSDLKQYQNIVEVYANKNNGLYPMWASGVQMSGVQFCQGSLSMTSCPEDPKYITDQINYTYYHYQSDGSLNNGLAQATQYVMWGKLENIDNTYWVVCSTGQSGKIASSYVFSGGACPDNLAQ